MTHTASHAPGILDHINAVDLDAIYREVASAVRDGRWGWLYTVFALVDADAMHQDALLALLTASLPSKSKIPSRARLFAQASKILDAELLAGLE